MRKNPNQYMYDSQHHYSTQKRDSKGRKEFSNQKSIHFVNSDEKMNTFHFTRYPFRNDEEIGEQFIKLTVSSQFEDQKLKKMMKISHPNLINIMKIIKGYPRQYPSSNQSNYYSFFYQNVPYSLKRAAAISECEYRTMESIKNINFSLIIRRLTQYLFSLGIFHFIKLEDIGLDNTFKIKIYVSPIVFLISGDEQIRDKRSVLKNNQKLISWWKTTFQINEQTPIRKSTQDTVRICKNKTENSTPEKIKNNNSSFLAPKTYQRDQRQDSIQKNKYNHISHHDLSILIGQIGQSIHGKSYEDDTQNFKKQSRSSSLQKLANMISFNNNTKLNQKVHINISEDIKKQKSNNNSFENKLEKSRKTRNTTKIRRIYTQFEKLRQKIQKAKIQYHNEKQVKTYQFEKDYQLTKEAIHAKQIFQSANLQNIYHNPQVRTHKFNKSSIQQQRNQKTNNIVNKYKSLFQEHRNTQPVIISNFSQEKSERSQTKSKIVSLQNIPLVDDSYDEVNDSFQVQDTLPASSSFRHSLEPSNRLHKISNFRAIDKEINNKGIVSPTSNSVTESAGPRKFKKIINNLIKPQFLAKSSNIFEVSREDQSQTSKSQRSLNNNRSSKILNEKDSNLATMYESQAREEIIQGSNISDINLKDSQFTKNTNRFQQIKSSQENTSGIYLVPSFCEDILSIKVKEALLKTKNAIDRYDKQGQKFKKYSQEICFSLITYYLSQQELLVMKKQSIICFCIKMYVQRFSFWGEIYLFCFVWPFKSEVCALFFVGY